MNFLKKFFLDKKNFFNLIILLFFGIILMLVNSSAVKKPNLGNNTQIIQTEVAKSENSYEDYLENKLEQTLKFVDGVGNIKVMIALKSSKELVTKNDGSYEKNVVNNIENSSNSITEKHQNNTVKVNGDNPFIIKEIQPTIEGVVIVAQGGGNIEIKNSLINATKALLDVEIHKIEVLKMK